MEHTTVFDGNVTHVTAKLVIKKMVQMLPGFKTGESIVSDPFMVGNTPMSIEVFPNGVESEGEFCIFLNNNGDDAISLKGELMTDVDTHIFDYRKIVPAELEDDEGGDDTTIGVSFSHAKCTEAYKDKDFVVTAKLETIGQPVKVVGNKKRKFNVFENVYKKMQRTDFTLVSELLSVAYITDRDCPVYFHCS